ncbi:HYR domain-containing protein, partial [Flavobacterium sp. DSR3-2]|uniref:HYR domain-containing protein n=1 Tax=Flavobacterium sp. DSR3-2 TaxID=2804634 RepID=UPI003CE9ECE2
MKKLYSESKIVYPIFRLFFIVIFFLGFAFSLNAQVKIPFKERTSTFSPLKKTYNVKGDFTMIGNTNLTLQNYGDNVTNDNPMIYVDIDNDSKTWNSSSSTLSLPTDNGTASSCSNIVYAGLYWTGRASDSDTNNYMVAASNGGVNKNFDKRVVSLKGPGESNYTNITASSIGNVNEIYYPNNSDGYMYSAYAEVTQYVKDHGVGEYFAADIALKQGNGGGTGFYGGWGLIVIYENSSMKNRDITVFDGHAYVKGSKTINHEIDVTGFNAVPSGNVGIKLGMIAGEGDRGISGDYFQIQKKNSSNYLSLNHSANSTNNFFNSSIQTGGNQRNPSLANNTGLDISMFTIPNADNSIIGNNQTATKFKYGSTQDTYVIFAIAMAVDAYVPDIEGIITATKIDNVPVSGTNPTKALPGQELEYKIQIENRGTEAINNTKIVIPIPYNATYIANSASKTINFTPNPSPNTLVYEPTTGANGSVVWDFGTLPLPVNGDKNSILAELTFKFKITEDCTLLKNINCNNVVSVIGFLSGTGSVSTVKVIDKSLIQGYTSGGNCQGTAIPTPYTTTIDAAAYVNTNCQATPPITAFTFCNAGRSIAITAVAGAFPTGATFYNSYPVVRGTTIQYTINKPFPATVGTSTYYAVPPGVGSDCYFQFTITVSSITSLPLVTDVKYCIDENTVPLIATASNPSYDLYYYTSETSSAQMSITPSSTTVGETTYYVAEGQTNSCIGPKKPIKVTVYPKPTVVAPVNKTFEGCETDALTGLPYSETDINITLSQFITAGGTFPNSSNVSTYSISYKDSKSGSCPIKIERTFKITTICGSTIVKQTIKIQDTTAPIITGTLSDVNKEGCSLTDLPPAVKTVAALESLGLLISDNCTTDLNMTVTNLDIINGNLPTVITRTYTVSDQCNNQAVVNQKIIIKDTVAPVTPVLADVTGQCAATATAPKTTDVCSGNYIVGTTLDPLTYTTQGTYTITWTFKDGNGNTTTATQKVIVKDTVAPVTPVLADVTAQCAATATAPKTTDVCSGNYIVGTTLDPLTYTTQGTYVITWTFKDGNGNTTTATQKVIVKDTIAPVTPVLADVTAQCAATATAPKTTDVCSGNYIVGTTLDPLTYTTQGTYVITWTFKDGNGNTTSATQKVIVKDTVAPVTPVLADVTGQCAATATAPKTTDVCSGNYIVGTTLDPLTYTTQGTYVITWTFKDGNGNTTSATQNVIVKDTVAPVTPVLADVTGQCAATATAPKTKDVCSGNYIVGTTLDPLTYTTQGTYTITWSFKDGNGNTTTATQKVIVKDTVAPVTPVLADVTAQCAATATAPKTTDVCSGNYIVGTTLDPLTYTTQGTYTITWSFKDGNGNTTTATQKVIVKDTVAPVTPVLADVTGQCAATATAPTTTDVCSGNYIVGTTLDPLTYTTQGTYVINWTFKDGNGNTTTATQKVIVKDTVAPVTPVLADVTGQCAATATAPTTTDVCSGTITGTTSTVFPITTQGTTVVTWTFDDGKGNNITATQNVIVKDNINPTITCAAPVTVPVDVASCTAAKANVTLGNPTTADNCEVKSVTNDAPTVFPIGNTTVTWTVTDHAGNTATCTQIVTVVDNINPTITCAGPVTVPVDVASCTAAKANVTLGNPTTTDNCEVKSVTNDAPTVFPIGNTTVTWTVTDNAGNTATCTQIVTVVDNINPTITCAAPVTVPVDVASCTAAKANVTLGNPTTADNCEVKSVTNDAPTVFPIGNTTVTWTVTDHAGNTATCTQIVTVVDNINPTITCAAPVTVPVDVASCTAAKANVTLGNPTTTDNCEVKSVTNDAPTVFPIGNTT